MKASMLITSKFEHYLQHDPLFVEYFNEFLLSPAFSKKLHYDNDAQMMVDKTQKRVWTILTRTKESRYSNLKKVDKFAESRTLIKWSKKNRLPFFLKSKGYLEYKLCRYLLHNKDSRQTSAMPISALDIQDKLPKQENSPTPSILDNRSESTTNVSIKSWPLIRDEFRMMHSRATSVPNMSLEMERAKSAGPAFSKDEAKPAKTLSQRPSTCGVSHDCVRNDIDEDVNVEFTDLCLDDTEGRASVLEFLEDDIDTSHTNNEVKDISLKRQLTLQELKAESIGSISGMDDFKEFLQRTTGHHLLRFWLDAEHYRDQVTGLKNAPEQRRESGIRLFRIMQDRYKHQLTKEAQEEISTVLQNEGYSEHLFLRAQSDILRRLKYYWLPRFLVHLELKSSSTDDSQNKLRSRLVSSMSFFPSLCVVKSLPTLGHILSEEARERSFTSLYEFRGHSRIKSGLMKKVTFNLPEESPEEDPLTSALNVEKNTGYPFLSFLKSIEDEDMLKSLEFWLDVDEFLKQDDRKEDRLYRVYTAWSIFNRYINEDNGKICANERVAERIRSHLSTAREITKETGVSLFADLQVAAEENIRTAWENFQAQEFDELQKASRNPTPVTAHQTKRVVVEDESGYSPSRWVKRNPGSSDSERRVRLQTALSMAEECNMSRMSSRALQADRTEAVKKKKKKRKKQVNNEERESGDENGNASARKEEKPKLSDIIDNKEAISAFKHFIQNEEGRGSFNNLSMCLDIEAYNEIHPAKRLSRQQQSSTIYRTYFDQASRRAVALPDEIIDKVEDEIPTTPTLLEAKYSVYSDLEASFEKFYKKMQHVLQREINTAATAESNRNGSEGYKPDTMESFRSYHSHVNAPKTGKKKRKGTGKAIPTKEDRLSFLEEVQASSGRLSTEMELFRKYLIVKEEPGAFPRLEKDLFFYVEVQKFKDLYPFLDEVALNRKVEVIIDVFLDSATPPWLQVDLNQEQAGKTIQKAQQYYSMTKRVPREQKDPYIFDEAQSAIQKEILPYWAGFCKQFRDSNMTPEFPMTKQEREHRKRQKEKMKMTLAHEKRSNRPKTPGFGESKHELTFSVGRGFKWKEAKIDLESVLSESSASGSRKSSVVSVR